jgi:hypothetical protein
MCTSLRGKRRRNALRCFVLEQRLMQSFIQQIVQYSVRMIAQSNF